MPLDHLRDENRRLPGIAWPGGYTILNPDAEEDGCE